MVRRTILITLLILLAVPAHVLTRRPGGNAAEAAEDTPQLATPTTAPDEAQAEFNQAGVCARCHVVSVLEWGISGHVDAETNCQKCHGPSKGHVANERNEVKPDRLPRGKAIAKQLCSTCHQEGCPETGQVENCQKCHHVHALIHPTKSPSAKNDPLQKLLLRWQQFDARMANGEGHVKQKNWSAARAEFQEAAKLIPGDRRARARLEMCTRRLDPQLAGFEIVTERFDAETGLPLEVRVVESDTRMLLVPPGEFDMGWDEWPDSRPQHTVGLDAFYLGKHEVTQKEWTAIMGSNPSSHQTDEFPHAERMPVERVSWDDCQGFVQRLNKRVAGGRFRLPTEAEWEYACRAASRDSQLDRSNSDSDTTLADRAWYRVNSLRQPNSEQPFAEIVAYAPRPVGARQANAWGFYDMQGNVSEWCSSLFKPYLYRATDGRESLTEPGLRVLRGGGFADSASSLDAAWRHSARANRRFRWNGLRLARSLPAS